MLLLCWLLPCPLVVRKKKLLLLTLLLLLLLLQKLLLLLRPLMLLLRPLLLLLTLLLRPLTLLPLLLLTLLPRPPLLQKKRSNLALTRSVEKSRSKTGFFYPMKQTYPPITRTILRECCDWPTAKHENSRHTARETDHQAEQGTDL